MRVKEVDLGVGVEYVLRKGLLILNSSLPPKKKAEITQLIETLEVDHEGLLQAAGMRL